MKLIVKDIDIAAGRFFIVLLSQEDARKMDLSYNDRIKIKKGSKEAVAFIDISTNPHKLVPGEIGIFEELLKELSLKEGDVLDILPAPKPASTIFIKKKMEGKHLTYDETRSIIDDIINNRLSEVELTYFVGATYAQGMTIEEISALTRAIVETGDRIKLNTYPVMDKHCIGGLPGNRTTPLVVSIVAAAGLTMPKTSSRAITSPSGTADTIEVMMEVNLTEDKMIRVVEKTGACMVWGGGKINLAPADDRIIQIEHIMDVDAEGQMLASILAKKLSVSATHVLIDLPVGKGAKLETRERAEKIKKMFEQLAKIFNLRLQVVLTDGSQPIGRGIGPLLEAKDILYVLMNDRRAPKDLEEKSLMMAGILLELGGKAKKGDGKKKALSILRSGKAYAKFKEIAEAQGKRCINPDALIEANFKYEYRSKDEGRVVLLDNRALSRVARLAGAPHDKKAGILLNKKVGDVVMKNELLFTIYSESAIKLQYAWEEFDRLDGVIIR